MEALCEAWLPPMVHSDRATDADFMRPLREMVASFTPELFAGQVAALLNRPDPAPVLPTIACPVLIGVGRQDAWSPPAQHEPIAAAIPGSRLVIFENAGHMAPYEAPDQVMAAMREWLTHG
jgi:pimeloyl-ACP methyl ester carboxylesterase